MVYEHGRGGRDVRDRDRFWWLMLILGLAFCAGAVAAPYWILQSFPTNDPYFTSADYWQLIGEIGFIVLMCLVGGLILVTMGLRARRRHRRRLAALRDGESALPLADMQPDATLAPDVSETPLALLWRMGAAARVYGVVVLGICALSVLITASLFVLALAAPALLHLRLLPEGMFAQTLQQSTSLMETVLRIAGASAIVAICTGIGVLAARITPFFFGRPFGVSASNSGIDARTELGSRIHMAWDEIRLLEVETGGSQSKRRFALYAPGQRVEWADYIEGAAMGYVPVGATASEMTRRQAALLGLIAARTGLAPRTLAKTLESRPASARDVKRSSQAIVLLVTALVVAGIAAADFLFPVTPFTWVNWASAGSMALVALSLLLATLWIALSRSTLPVGARPPSVDAPSLDALAVAYSFSWRMPPLRRLAFMLIGLCLAVNLVAGAWALLRQFASTLPGFQTQLLSEGGYTDFGHFMLALVLGGFGLLGLRLVYTAVILAINHIRADRDGLTTGNGRRERLVAWSSVRDISWGPGRRGQFAYLVATDVPTVQISWPAGSQAVEAIPPSDGSLPIGGDELAALVAARIGKPIRVRGG
jgi:hypothetical protein